MPRKTLNELVGAYDNLDEPKPLWNHPSVLVGVTVSFTVRAATAMPRLPV